MDKNYSPHYSVFCSFIVAPRDIGDMMRVALLNIVLKGGIPNWGRSIN